MKNGKLVLLFAALFVFTNVNAQLLKKLKKRAEEAAKEAVSRKVEQKTERETEKAFDTVFNNNGRLFKGKKAKVSAGYSFSHQYVMDIVSEKDTIEMTYYLTNNHEYMGSSFNTGKTEEFITVMDLPNAAIHTFMDFGGQKSMTSFKIDLDASNDVQTKASQFDIVSTGQTKDILGYLCEEFQVTGPKISGKIWVTKDANISFQKAFNVMKTKKMKRTKGIDQSWVSMVDGLALEMVMVDYSRKKPKPVKMICKSISEQDFSLQTAEYQK